MRFGLFNLPINTTRVGLPYPFPRATSLLLNPSYNIPLVTSQIEHHSRRIKNLGSEIAIYLCTHQYSKSFTKTQKQ